MSGFVRDDVTLDLDLAAGAERLNRRCRAYGVGCSAADRPGDYPASHRRVASAALSEEDDPDSEFDFGLERILDGVAALIARDEA